MQDDLLSENAAPSPPPVMGHADGPATVAPAMEKNPQAAESNGSSRAVFVVATIMVGIGAGLGGMTLALVLHLIQHLAYGYSLDAVISPESFLQGVSAATPVRRVAVLALCGAIAGFGWFLVYRFGRPLVSIRRAVDAQTDHGMPVLSTTVHALLQIVTVALGSPLGREVAPREIAATFAGWLSSRLGLSAEDGRILVACGAGAGLAAVYNVPLAGALFTLEVLLTSFRLPALIPAVATSVIAAMVAWIGLGDEAQYEFQHFALSSSLVAWSIVAGPFFGFGGYWYARLAAAARRRAPRDGRLVLWCVASFVLIGLLSIQFPQLLGNGKGPTQLGFDSHLGIGLAASLLLLKLFSTTATLWAGAEGGLLTPGLTIGALLAIILGTLWNLVFPQAPPGAFAIVGATAFLAASMKMPLTAIALLAEFTRVDHDLLFPMLFAVAGSMSLFHVISRKGRGLGSTTPSVISAPPGAQNR
ncbi:MAG: chloride channel protein [Azospirillaceae bacterium]|nr:chloride channel protein [Azospirillaceae bacterium]